MRELLDMQKSLVSLFQQTGGASPLIDVEVTR